MRRFILCAGIEYKKLESAPFLEYCKRRRAHLLKSVSRGEELSIAVFDFKSGTVQTTTITWPGGKAHEITTTEKKFSPITRESLGRKDPVTGEINNYALKDNQTDIMSIVNIYEVIQEVGAIDPGSLFEVSVFSHGYLEGPILVNSWDDRRVSVGGPLTKDATGKESYVGVSKGRRDPDDKDGRAILDFAEPEMPSKKKGLFKNAFNSRGYFWTWGCNFEPPGGPAANQVLLRLEKNQKYQTNISDTQPLEFSGLNKEEMESFLVFNNIFKLDPAELRRTRKCTLTFKAIKEAIWAETAASYPFQLYANTRVKAIGALFSTYSSFDMGSPLDPKAPRLLAISTDTARHTAFYKRHFNFSLDHEGRNYGVFDGTLKAPE